MTQKRTRRKSYKNMSVTELVKARSDLQSQMDEIDDILGLAVEAVGAKKEIAEKIWNSQRALNANSTFRDTQYSTPPTDRAFASSINRDGSLQVDVGDAPIMQPSMDSRSDLMSGFALWDADSYAREQAEASKLAMQDQQPQTEYDVDSMQDEISTLKQEITNSIRDVQNTTTNDGGSKENIPSIAQ